MKTHWLDQVKRRLEQESSRQSGLLFERLVEEGIINERGEVTGHAPRWDAYLAIVEVKRAGGDEKIAVFRCLKPVFGMPGGATIDVSRESLVSYLSQGKKVITAHWDERLGMWKQGTEVRLSPRGFVRSGPGGDELKDDVGSLPEFSQSTSRL